MRARQLTAALVLCLALAAAAPAVAQALSGGPDLSWWSRAMAWIAAQQRIFHDQLSASLRALTADGGATAAATLIVGSFLYGIFHAAGPGHGKAVLTTYLLTNRERMRRGMAIAAASAFMQGLVAVVLVYGLIYVAGWLPRDTSAAIDWSERMSYALVAAIGLWLVARAVRAGWAVATAGRPGAVAAGDAHGPVRHNSSEDQGDHHACGHAHGPTPQQVERAGDLRTALGVVFSIGLRPCSGAVLVLVFAKVLGLPWAGVAAVAAMSAGTAMAVTALATLAVKARDWAASAVPMDGLRWQLAANGVALAGGGVLMAIGVSLMATSFAPPHPLGL